MAKRTTKATTAAVTPAAAGIVTPVQHLRSSVAGRRPTPGAHRPGEIFINFADKVVGYIDSAGNPIDYVPSGGAAYTLPPATAAALGGVYATLNPGGQFVTGINAAGQLTYGTPATSNYTLPPASAGALGGIYSGTAGGGQFVTGVNTAGQLTYGAPSPYNLPVATTATIGGVKSGTATANRFVTNFDATGAPVLGQVSAAGVLSGPSFAAYLTSSSITVGNTNTLVKVIVNSVEDNTGGFYNAATGRFTPNVPGWYHTSLGIQQTTGTPSYFYVAILKTGAQEITGNCQVIANSSNIMSSCSSVVKLNGTTDYLESWAACSNATSFNNLRAGCYFTATFLRS